MATTHNAHFVADDLRFVWSDECSASDLDHLLEVRERLRSRGQILTSRITVSIERSHYTQAGDASCDLADVCRALDHLARIIDYKRSRHGC